MPDNAAPSLRAALSALDNGGAADEAKALLASPAFQRAADFVAEDHGRIVADIIRLTEIPSPPFGEAVRAAAFAEALREQGLRDVATDTEGNVTALRPGTDPEAGLVVICSHLDTVFPAGTDVTVKRQGTILRAPGVGDDTRGLAVMLGLLRALDAAGIKTRAGILAMGSVGEEGAGDLRGVKAFFKDDPRREQIAAFMALDGLDPSRLVTAAVGSKRYRITFRGPGGHSFGAFGLVNPAFALARAADALSRIRVPAEPKTTFSIGRIGGGSSINAIPEEMWMEVDLRSASPAALAALEQRFLDILPQAAADENAARDTTAGKIQVEVKVIGDRPAGATEANSRIVKLAEAVIGAQGYSFHPEASSTDSNIAMNLGLPAITVGSGCAGGRAHSLEEWIDVEPKASAHGIATAMGTLLALAGVEASAG
ncbi:M20/M25/M40 family metallo-hydrolase [Roseomonas marmotae]|uniref:M20/M25/M40 family metallo-hydrolase n=1 Tax=Roseomonas marmotae TaxID=2768161 RepID=A0ABS3KH71_9PROT|nr:M20/M25/M40 family metallo-hydrolase [Roseomonas marmotae]MBO1076804.1 M20/M25/M40 family metallo-hydrolase [Roseomonas marmotae]QTI78731.1 M20/M25/M40 family metallo-hydrolase [Roseomonas marmotae]